MGKPKRLTPRPTTKAAVAACREAIKAHGKLCNICTQLTRTRGRYCDPGWELQEALIAALKEHRAAEAAALRQDTLF